MHKNEKIVLVITTLILALAMLVSCTSEKNDNSSSLIDEKGSGALFWKENSMQKTLLVRSGSFENGSRIPTVSTCDAGDAMPNLIISNTPEKTISYAIIIEDPDASSGTFMHFLAWNIPPWQKIDEGTIISKGVVGKNDFQKNNYIGPCPPIGETHRYFFKVYAMNKTISLKADAKREDVFKEIESSTLSYGEIVGVYSK
jgi:hypothetical protein